MAMLTIDRMKNVLIWTVVLVHLSVSLLLYPMNTCFTRKLWIPVIIIILNDKPTNSYHPHITSIHFNNRIGTSDPSPATATSAQMLRAALILVTCVLGVMSILTFIIGFVCGHCFSQRWRKSAGKNNESPSESNPTTEPGEDLELKENVAYVTLHPK